METLFGTHIISFIFIQKNDFIFYINFFYNHNNYKNYLRQSLLNALDTIYFISKNGCSTININFIYKRRKKDSK